MEVVVELTHGICNSKCVWCFSQYKNANRLVCGFMSLENFKKFTDLNHDFNMQLIPFSHGESLLNPEFIEICEHARSLSNIAIRGIHSNFAMNLTQRYFETICRHNSIVINFGGGTQTTHHQNMKTDLGVVISNVQQLLKTKERLGSGLTIHPKIVVNRRNQSEIEILRGLLKKIGVKEPLQVLPIYFSCSDSDNEDRMRFVQENLIEGLPCRDSWKVVNGKVIVEPIRGECNPPMRVLTIRWNGGVHICCRARYHEGFVGNAFEEPIRKIMASDRYKEAVEQSKRREYVEYCKYCS